MKVLITDRRTWGRRSEIAVHQIVDDAADIDNAIYNADRDDFDTIVLYAEIPAMLELAAEVAARLPDAFIKVGHRTVSKASLKLVVGGNHI